MGFLGGLVVKNLPANEGHVVLVPGLGRSPREENGNPPQNSAWKFPWTGEPGGIIVHGVTMNWS